MTATEDSVRGAWLREARAHLRNADPVLAGLIDERPDFDPQVWIAHLRPPMSLYDALLWQGAWPAPFLRACHPSGIRLGSPPQPAGGARHRREVAAVPHAGDLLRVLCAVRAGRGSARPPA